MAWGRRTDDHPRAIDDEGLRARLGAGERLLAAAFGTSAGLTEAVGGSDRALYLPGDARLGWNEVERATWDRDEFRLDVVTLPIDAPARTYAVEIAEPGRLPELVRERVMSSIVVNQQVAI